MKKKMMEEHIASKIVRVIMGLFLVFTGLNFLFSFLPAPEFGAEAVAFFTALAATGYMLPIIGIVLVLGGIFYVIGKCKAFATLLIVPITFNMALFDIFIEFAIPPIGIILFLLNLWYLYTYREFYMPFLSK